MHDNFVTRAQNASNNMKGDAPLRSSQLLTRRRSIRRKKAQLPLDFGGVKDSIQCVLQCNKKGRGKTLSSLIKRPAGVIDRN